MRRRLFVFALALAVSVLAAAAAPAYQSQPPPATGSGKGCPKAATCSMYRLGSERWKPAAGGDVVIHYRLNYIQPWALPGDVFAAIDTAARAWEDANPHIHFVFEGTTVDPPQLGDNVNEIAWVAGLGNAVSQTNHRAKGSARLEADTLLNVAMPWGWTPCGGSRGSCTDAAPAAGLKRQDLAAVMTHEFGHWLGIETLTAPSAGELTMFGTIRLGERKQATLGLGDVAASRAAYPCPGCRMPIIETP